MAVANNPYPQDVRVRREAETLAAAGYAVRVIAPAAHGQPGREACGEIRVLRYPPPPEARNALGYAFEFAYGTLAVALLLAWIWLREGFDVLHVHNPPDTLVLAGLIPKLFGKRLVYDHHDLAPELYRAKYEQRGGGSRLVASALGAFERLSCALADRVVVVNDSYLRTDIERNRVDPARIAVVRNGPPMADARPIVPDAGARGDAAIAFGYLGHIGVQDGVDHLLWALHHLDAEYGIGDWVALVIGPADEPDALHRLVDELGIADRVRFLGLQPDEVWRPVLASVDICSVPDPPNPLNERSTMIKAMEYMALGRPIVAYDLPEHRVSAGEAALYAEAGDPRAMADRFARLARDPEARRRMGEEGRRRIRDGLAWEFSAERLLTMYDGLLERERVAPARRTRARGR